ncbi:MAG: hypothetical protein V1894_01640 [Chloroflexota bacterium]
MRDKPEGTGHPPLPMIVRNPLHGEPIEPQRQEHKFALRQAQGERGRKPVKNVQVSLES